MSRKTDKKQPQISFKRSCFLHLPPGHEGALRLVGKTCSLEKDQQGNPRREEIHLLYVLSVTLRCAIL
jgi:hypothetical protein